MSKGPRQSSINLGPRVMCAVVTTDGSGNVAFVPDQNYGFSSVALSGVQGIMLLSYSAPTKLGGVIGIATATETATDTILSCTVLPDGALTTRCGITFRDALGALVDLENVAVRVVVHLTVI